MRSFLALSCGLFIAGVKAQNLFNLPAINPSLIAACFPSGQSASTSPCMDAQSALYKCYSAFDPNNLNATQNCFCAAGANNYLSTSQGCFDCLMKASNGSSEAPILSQYSTDFSKICSATIPPQASSFISEYVTNFGLWASYLDPAATVTTDGSTTSAGSMTTATVSSQGSTDPTTATAKTATATATSSSSTTSPTSAASRRGVGAGMGVLGAIAGGMVALM